LVRELPGWTFAGRAATVIAAGATTLAMTLRAMVASLAPAVRALKHVTARIEKEEARQEDALREKEKVVQRDVDELVQQENRARAEVSALERQIEEMRAGKRLHRFITERHASGEYSRHLGVINLIRNDFQKLSELLAGSEQEKQDGHLPPVDRIVLYIDDLDRCPEDRVVEVLQAVHLLLAFPLFVVVVGVDSRWLMLSLEDHYTTLRGRTSERTGSARKSEAEWTTTPQNYLEKIFQIPFTLRPMAADGFGSLVEVLLPLKGSAEPLSAVAAVPRAAASDPLESDTSAGDPLEGFDGDPLDETPREPSPTLEPLPAVEKVISGPPPNPQGLTVEKSERDFIKQLAPLIASPRALKRFTNVYRFLRVQQRGSALDRFLGTDGTPGEFEVVALLLAALSGYPAEATDLLQRVLTTPGTTWWDLVAGLDASTRRAGGNGAGARRPALRDALLRVRDTVSVAEHPPEAFARWAREVARFSFQSGRILAVREHREDKAAVPTV
ncbi:MAG TPA: P-loop NTPase fold protein, partial [Longimicrobium sp.]|nr:P-loop NTPase fold protein [Longimicrobium sp.]